MRPYLRSLLWRIVGLHIMAVAACLAVIAWTMAILLNVTAQDIETRTLRAHAEALAHNLKWMPQGKWQLTLPQDLSTLYLHHLEGFSYAIRAPSGQVIMATRNDARGRWNIPQGRSYGSFRRTGHTSDYVAGIEKTIAGHDVWIEVSQNIDHPDVIFDDIIGAFLGQAFWVMAPILFLLLYADIFMIRRVLAPVIEASRLAREIDPLNLDVRLPADSVPLEVLPLVEGMNHALDRLKSGFEALREFTADAAHELRTPLAVLRLRLDTNIPPETAAILRKDLDAMTYVVEQLLAAAELESMVVSTEVSEDLCTITRDVVAHLAPLAVSQHKAIAFDGAPAPVLVRASAPMLFQAIRNLAENALAHAPLGTTVEVAVTADGCVTVSDEGPGIAPDQLNQLFRRFWRGNRAKSPGMGLGLAIVRRIVDVHGGRVFAENQPNGGAKFIIEIPLHDRFNAPRMSI